GGGGRRGVLLDPGVASLDPRLLLEVPVRVLDGARSLLRTAEVEQHDPARADHPRELADDVPPVRDEVQDVDAVRRADRAVAEGEPARVSSHQWERRTPAGVRHELLEHRAGEIEPDHTAARL